MKKITLYSLFAILIFMSSKAFAQTIRTFAGKGGISGFGGDGGPATAANFNSPQSMAIDASGTLYIADTKNHCIRKIKAGTVSTIAGTGAIAGYAGDGGAATSAKMNEPVAVAVDGSGNVFVADASNNAVRKISTAGIITTIAGTGVAGYGGDGAAATSAKLNTPNGVWVDPAGNVYIGDTWNHRVRKVNTSGIISTFAGTGVPGYGGDGFAATNAQLYYTNGITMDAAGNFYMTDNGNHRVRKVNTSGIISTVAGNGVGGYITDGVPATSTEIYFPVGVKTDASGNIYFGEDGNSRVRKVDASGIISTIAGTGISGFSGDGGAATLAQFRSPTDVCLDASGNIYIADRNNHCIRIIGSNSAPSFTHGTSQTLNLCANSAPTSIDALMEITDADLAQTETWTILTAPLHGTALVSYTSTSTGTTITPTGLTYQPATGYVGTDLFKVVISDGFASDTTNINVTVDPLPNAGVISGIDSVCPGFTQLMSETVSGGIWSTSNFAMSSVTFGGTVKGVTPGRDTIIYTVVNSCGIVSAIFPFTVRSYIACHTGVANMNLSAEGMNVYPNPSSGTFTLNIQTTDSDQAIISIQNVLSVRVQNFSVPCNQPVSLNVNLPSGIYLVNAVTPHMQWSSKIVINKGR